jgi:hypothetical protein
MPYLSIPLCKCLWQIFWQKKIIAPIKQIWIRYILSLSGEWWHNHPEKILWCPVRSVMVESMALEAHWKARSVSVSQWILGQDPSSLCSAGTCLCCGLSLGRALFCALQNVRMSSLWLLLVYDSLWLLRKVPVDRLCGISHH